MASNLHKELSIRAISWMNSRMTASGIRWATEFQIESGWVADCVALAFPQIRYFDKIKKIANHEEALKIWHKDIYPDAFLYVFETKVSRQDFNKSFANNGYKNRLIGNLHYVITTKDLISKDELPEGWGWLIKSGNGLREIITPKLNEIDDAFRFKIGYRMLWIAYGYRSSIEDWELKRGQLF